MKVTNVYDLKEYVSAHDSCSPIRGYVVMTDEDGKTLFAKHNMIVENGRELIRDLVYDNVFYTNINDISKANRTVSFSSIKFGNNNSVTIPSDIALHGDKLISFNIIRQSISPTEDIIKSINMQCLNSSTKKYENKSIADDDLSISNTDGGQRCILISAKIDISDITATPTISEAGLFFNEGGTEKLFSRVAFAPITINSNNVYNLNYYIYF